MGGIDGLVPRRRRKGLIVERLRAEMLVYDQQRDEVHCLTGVAAAVFELCEAVGTRTELAAMATERTGERVDEALVEEVIGELGALGLLTARPNMRHGLSRRQVIRRGAIAGATAAMITTIAAPTPALAQSGGLQPCGGSLPPCPQGRTCTNTSFSGGQNICCVPLGGNCSGNFDCCSGNCDGTCQPAP